MIYLAWLRKLKILVPVYIIVVKYKRVKYFSAIILLELEISLKWYQNQVVIATINLSVVDVKLRKVAIGG